MPVTLAGWKPLRKGSLLRFATVRLGRSLTVHDVPVLSSGGRRWAALPGKPQIDGDGRVRTGDNGKALYTPVLEWCDKQTRERFSQAVIDAIEREHPGALEAAA